MDLDDVADYFTKNRYYDRFDETRWREQLEEHPLLMTKAPDPNNIPPLVEAIRQLKYGEESNSPEELAEQYKFEGDELYKQKKFKSALENYSKAIRYLDEEVCDSEELRSALAKCVLYSKCQLLSEELTRTRETIRHQKNKIDPSNKALMKRLRPVLTSLDQREKDTIKQIQDLADQL